jgi:hypothetical protein
VGADAFVPRASRSDQLRDRIPHPCRVSCDRVRNLTFYWLRMKPVAATPYRCSSPSLLPNRTLCTGGFSSGKGSAAWLAYDGGTPVVREQWEPLPCMHPTGTVATSLQSAPIPQGIAFDGGNIWVANSGRNNVTELLAMTGSVLGTFRVAVLQWALLMMEPSAWCATGPTSGSRAVAPTVSRNS